MKVELPLGEVVDKVTILLIKEQHIKDPAKLSNVARELATLREAWAEAGHPALEGLADWRGLRDINQRLWNVEDDIRDCERDGDFGDTFVRLARSVYHLNDQRAAHKRAINIALGSRLLEEKSYRDYKDAGGKPARTAPPSRGGGHPPAANPPDTAAHHVAGLSLPTTDDRPRRRRTTRGLSCLEDQLVFWPTAPTVTHGWLFLEGTAGSPVPARAAQRARHSYAPRSVAKHGRRRAAVAQRMRATHQIRQPRKAR